MSVRKLFFLFSLCLFCASATTFACDEFLTDASSKKVQEKIKQLNPEISFNPQSSREETLLFLKNEIWKLLPDGFIPWKDKPELDEALKTHLRTQFKKAFRTEDMNEEALYLFYANQWRSIYFLTLREWMEHQVAEESHDMKLSHFQKNVSLSLMSRSLSSAGLMRDTLSPTMAQDILQKKAWKEFSWPVAFEIIAQFPQESRLSVKEVMDWLHQNPMTEKLSPSEKSHLEAALREASFQNPCCLTDPGCLLCPNSRNWLRGRPSTSP